MMRLFSLSLIFLISAVAFGGDSGVDSTLYKKLDDNSPQVHLLHETMLTQRAANDIPASIVTATTIVKQLQDGPEEQLAIALQNLATLQMEEGELGAAVSNLNSSIALIEHSSGAYAPELIQPLYSLGAVQRVIGKYDEASESFRRSQHIVHRQDGVYSVDQLKILDQLTLVDISLGQISDADKEQAFYFRINEREYGEASPELLPAISKYAQYLGKVGQFKLAVFRYQEALDIIEQHYGKGDIRSIEPWQGIAEVRLNEKEFFNFGPTIIISDDEDWLSPGAQNQPDRDQFAQLRPRLEEAEYALARVLDIINQQEETDITDQIMALVHLGDIHTVSNSPEALDYYRQALQVMKDKPELAQLSNELFALPTRIYPRANYTFTVDVDIAPEEPFFAETEFVVTRTGRPTNIEISNSNMPAQERKLLKKIVYLYRYRPRLLDDEFASSDITINQFFQARVRARPENTGTLKSSDTESD